MPRVVESRVGQARPGLEHNDVGQDCPLWQPGLAASVNNQPAIFRSHMRHRVASICSSPLIRFNANVSKMGKYIYTCEIATVELLFERIFLRAR